MPIADADAKAPSSPAVIGQGVLLHVKIHMFLKQETPEMDDFEEKKLWF